MSSSTNTLLGVEGVAALLVIVAVPVAGAKDDREADAEGLLLLVGDWGAGAASFVAGWAVIFIAARILSELIIFTEILATGHLASSGGGAGSDRRRADS